MRLSAAFGAGQAGLGTVGYRQYDDAGGDAVARTTTGVFEIGQGAYGVNVALDPAAAGIEWDTGGGTPIYAHEDFPYLPPSGIAFPNIPFLFVAASDHVTPVTGATGIVAERSIDGGVTFVAATGTVTEATDGAYYFDASVADMTGGKITFKFTATGGVPGPPDPRFVTIITAAGI